LSKKINNQQLNLMRSIQYYSITQLSKFTRLRLCQWPALISHCNQLSVLAVD